MGIKDLQNNWDTLGKSDPLWSILTWRGKKGNRWDVDDFFTTGEREISLVMEHLRSLGVPVSWRRALDFGCGIGRLTRPLTNYFEEMCGIDVAPSMIEMANKYNRCVKCRYYVNDAEDLKLFSDNFFDFVHTSITLQHMEPRYARNYIKEFLRVLVPGGLLVFQLPSEPAKTIKGLSICIIPSFLLNTYRQMEMHSIKREEVVGFS